MTDSLERVRCRLLDIEVTPMDRDKFTRWLRRRLEFGWGGLVVGHNLHSAYLYHSDAQFQRFYRDADVILTDGAPIVADCRLTTGHSSERLGSTDWMPQIMDLDVVQRVAVVGSSSESNSRLVDRILQHHSMSVLGIPGKDWTEEKASDARTALLEFRPQLILVGLGMPLQEQFVESCRHLMPQSVFATVGGAIDQLAGFQRHAPRWLGKYGLEWLWRLAHEPRRLGHRYMIEPWHLLSLRARQSLTRGR